MADNSLLQQTIDEIKREQVSSATPEKDSALLKQTLRELGAKPQEENIWEAPEFVQKIAPLKAAVGTGQELAEFLGNIPKLFGADFEVPKAVETGLGEKAGAGIIEYLLGGAGAKAIPAIGKGFQALGKVPAVGRALASPMAQRALGGAAMGAIEQPEEPLKGAALGGAISPAVELGFKLPVKTVDMLVNAKWSPFHNMMMPHIKREFNEFLLNTGRKLGLSEENDVNKALFGKLKGQYGAETKISHGKYEAAKKAFRDVKKPVYWKEGLRGRTMPLIKDIRDTYEKSTDSFGIKINKTMKNLEQKIDENPVDFRRAVHKAEGEALKTGNHDLLESLRDIENKFDKNLSDLVSRTKDPRLSKALELMKGADTNFKNKVVPLRERSPVKVAEGAMKRVPTKFFEAYGKDTSKGLSKKITSSIEELEHMSKVSPEAKEHFILGLLQEGYNNPEKFIKEYSALKKEQKDAIFSKEQISRFNKFKKVYEKNPMAFKAAEPRTFMGAVRGTPLAMTVKAISALPTARERYMGGGSPIFPKSVVDLVKNMLIGASIGTTKK